MSDSGITIELTRTQIDHVLRGDSHEGGIASVLRRLSNQDLSATYAALSASPRLSRSLMLGLLVFACFPTDGQGLAVTDVAARLELSASTTHRYMSTLLAAGLLEQDPRTRRYRVPTPA
jgi:DNA-binding MarR family transcriptional regulator